MNTLLTELDGLDERRDVYVIAATNRPDMIDPAMCRPGRLDKLLYVDLPTAEERVEIITTLTRKLPLGDSANALVLQNLVREGCEGYSGADLSALVREAGVIALKRVLGAFDLLGANQEVQADLDVIVTPDDFRLAITKLSPSVSPTQRKRYLALRNKFAGLSLRVKDGGDGESQNPNPPLGVSA